MRFLVRIFGRGHPGHEFIAIRRLTCRVGDRKKKKRCDDDQLAFDPAPRRLLKHFLAYPMDSVIFSDAFNNRNT